MQHKFKKELWTPVITEHPKPSVGFRKHRPHIFNNWQPISERYKVPGLIPKKTLREEEKPIDFLAEQTDEV